MAKVNLNTHCPDCLQFPMCSIKYLIINFTKPEFLYISSLAPSYTMLLCKVVNSNLAAGPGSLVPSAKVTPSFCPCCSESQAEVAKGK